jgi:hypothetical protein
MIIIMKRCQIFFDFIHLRLPSMHPRLSIILPPMPQCKGRVGEGRFWCCVFPYFVDIFLTSWVKVFAFWVRKVRPQEGNVHKCQQAVFQDSLPSS